MRTETYAQRSAYEALSVQLLYARPRQVVFRESSRQARSPPVGFLSNLGLSFRQVGRTEDMPLGTSIFLLAVGAILRYAVTATVSGISITTVGLILMIVGALGLVLSLLYMVTSRPRGSVVRERVVERDPY